MAGGLLPDGAGLGLLPNVMLTESLLPDGGGLGLQPDIGGRFLPTQISGLVDWHRSDLGITLVGSNVSAWADQSGNGRDLTQGTDARRPVYVAAGINGLPVLRFGNGDFAANRFMSWADPAHTNDETMFAVVRYVSQTGDYQAFAVGGSGMTRYIANTGTDRPTIFGTVARALGTAMTGNTNYLVKWATADLSTAQKYYTQVNGIAEVSEEPGGTIAAGTLHSLGMDTAIVASQDLQSDVAELIIYNRRLTTAEESQIRTYVSARYGIVM